MFGCVGRLQALCRCVGVVESVLARVMDAFQVRMQGALLAASVKTLSESPAVARLMAAEPAAPQAGSPVAFFTGRHTDSVDAFVTDVLNNTGGAHICPCAHKDLHANNPRPQNAVNSPNTHTTASGHDHIEAISF